MNFIRYRNLTGLFCYLKCVYVNPLLGTFVYICDKFGCCKRSFLLGKKITLSLLKALPFTVKTLLSFSALRLIIR